MPVIECNEKLARLFFDEMPCDQGKSERLQKFFEFRNQNKEKLQPGELDKKNVVLSVIELVLTISALCVVIGFCVNDWIFGEEIFFYGNLLNLVLMVVLLSVRLHIVLYLVPFESNGNLVKSGQMCCCSGLNSTLKSALALTSVVNFVLAFAFYQGQSNFMLNDLFFYAGDNSTSSYLMNFGIPMLILAILLFNFICLKERIPLCIFPWAIILAAASHVIGFCLNYVDADIETPALFDQENWDADSNLGIALTIHAALITAVGLVVGSVPIVVKKIKKSYASGQSESTGTSSRSGMSIV